MSKITKYALIPIAATLSFSLHATANENSLSPVDFLLSEAGVSETTISKNGQRSYTPHRGYETVSLRTKNMSRVKVHGKNVRKNKDIDDITLDLGQDKARCEDLEKKLTAKYGAPISSRNNIRVWELKNANFTAGQSKKITIMAGEENGRYFVKLDRKGTRAGNNPRTNASLRKTSAIASSPAKSRNIASKINNNVRD